MLVICILSVISTEKHASPEGSSSTVYIKTRWDETLSGDVYLHLLTIVGAYFRLALAV